MQHLEFGSRVDTEPFGQLFAVCVVPLEGDGRAAHAGRAPEPGENDLGVGIGAERFDGRVEDGKRIVVPAELGLEHCLSDCHLPDQSPRPATQVSDHTAPAGRDGHGRQTSEQTLRTRRVAALAAEAGLGESGLQREAVDGRVRKPEAIAARYSHDRVGRRGRTGTRDDDLKRLGRVGGSWIVVPDVGDEAVLGDRRDRTPVGQRSEQRVSALTWDDVAVPGDIVQQA